MPNPIQRMLRQASESVPGQRPLRLPWQQPTLGERAAETLDTLADSSGEAEDRLNTINDRVTRRAQAATRTGRATLADAREQAMASLTNAQAIAQERASKLAEQSSTRLDDLRQTARDHASALKRRARDHVGAATELISGQGTSATDDGILTDAAARAEWSAARAERASHAASTSAAQMADALNRILQPRGEGHLRAEVAEASPTDVEIRLGEAAESPLMRAAEAVARVVAAAGETVYDYSGGHYGLEPVNASELRRERQREKRHARPVAIIEGHYEGDSVQPSTRKRSRTPLLIAGLAAGIAALGLAYSQRGRLRPLLDQLRTRIPGGSPASSTRLPNRNQKPLAPPTPTPAFDRVVSGQLLELQTAGASTPTGRAAAPEIATHDGVTRTYLAGEPSQSPPQP